MQVGEIAGLGMFGYTYGWVGVERRADGDWLLQSTREGASDGGPVRDMRDRRIQGGPA